MFTRQNKKAEYRKGLILCSLLLVFFLLPIASSFAAYEFYFKIEGVTQGEFKGECLRASRQEWLVGLSFNHGVISPRDAASGLPTGKIQHRPITVTKEWGQASPQIYQALVTNERLPNVTFEFIRINQTGVEEVYQRIILTNATISGVFMSTGASNAQISEKTATFENMELESITFTYERITWENLVGSTMAQADWTTK